MAFHLEHTPDPGLKLRGNASDEPCLDLASINLYRGQVGLRRSYVSLMVVNALLLMLFLVSLFLNFYDGGPASISTAVASIKEKHLKIPVLALTVTSPTDTIAPTSPDVSETPVSPLTLVDEELLLTELYETVGPAVVKVVVVRRGQVDLTHAVPRGDSSGSGVIFDRQGRIVTNLHVVNQATDVVVQLSSGRTVKAEVLGEDPGTDLAVLDIDVPATELTIAPFTDSNALRVGQIAIAIGHPFGLDNSLTVGHISGLNRELPTKDKYTPVVRGAIQTDAAINPGNSGGPLFNLRGQVVGINTVIFSTNQGSQGVGFALPSNTVRSITAELIEKGFVSRPFLGVVGLSLDSERADRLDIEIKQGLLIQEVSRQSPAWQAGLRPGTQWMRLNGWPVRVGGDILMAIDDQPIDSMTTLSTLLQEYAIGDVVNLRLYRAGEEIEMKVTLSERSK